MVTMVWVVGRFRLRTPLAFHLHISPLTSSGRSNSASRASQPEKSVTLRHRQRADHEVQEYMWWHWARRLFTHIFVRSQSRALNKIFIISRYFLFELYPRYGTHYSDQAKGWTILGSNSNRLGDSSLLQPSRQALEPIQRLTQWLSGVLSSGAHHSSPSSALVKNGGAIPPRPLTCLHGAYKSNFTINLYVNCP
jgi:hypothetical protein